MDFIRDLQRKEQARTGTIITLGSGWVLVLLDSGSRARIPTRESWRIGERISILGGRIIGQAGGRVSVKTYQV